VLVARIVVRRIDGGNVVEDLKIHRAGFGIAAPFEGVFDVGRCYSLAGVELHARTEMERIGQQVRALVEPFGEARDDLKILVDRAWDRS
jgi:hypothetical protein